MARLNARWYDFVKRGQAWDHFWQDSRAALTNFASFTADAVLRKNASSSLTADAVIASASPPPSGGTFSAILGTGDTQFGQIVLGTGPSSSSSTPEASFTADAILKKVQSGSIAADAIFRKAGSGSLTANAILKITVSSSVAANTVLLRSQSGSLTANAWVGGAGAGAFTADAVLKKNLSGSFSANAVFKKTQTGSFSADAILLRSASGTFAGDAVVKKAQTASFSADAILRKTVSGSFTGDAWIAGAGAGSFTADAIFKRTQAGSLSGDSVFLKAIAGSFVVDAVVATGTQSRSFTANAVLHSTRQLHNRWTEHSGFDHAVDHVLAQGFGPYLSGENMAAVLAEIDARITAREGHYRHTLGHIRSDSVLKGTQTRSFTANAVLA